MRAKKIFCVVAYDVADTKRRNKVIKLIEPYGKRINYSVFECMFTAAQFERLRMKLELTVDGKTDKVAVYPICMDCYAKAIYVPECKDEYNVVHVY